MKGILLFLVVASLLTFISSVFLFKNLLLNVISLHSLFLFSTLHVYYDKNYKKLLENLSIFKSTPIEALLYGVGCLLIMFVIYLISFFVLKFMGFDDSSYVSNFIQKMPLSVLFIAIFIAPITEELFFRRLMLEKLGILLSSVIFMLFHISYGSVVELVGAFILALVLCLLAERKGVLPCIVTHMLYNTSTLLAIKVFML